MLGNGENPGIMPRATLDLFEMIEKEDKLDFKIKISYIEVYNETLRDLLGNSEQAIDLRDDPKLGSIVVGAKEIVVTNTHEVFNLLMFDNLLILGKEIRIELQRQQVLMRNHRDHTRY